jgi:hypothetical protein
MAQADIRPREPRTNRWICYLILVTVFASTFALSRGLVTVNDGSVYALVRALYDEGRTEIDSFVAYTGFIDYSIRDGHYYSDKAPGTAFVALPFYALGRWLSDHHALAAGEKDIERVTTLVSAAAPAVTVLLVWLISIRVGATKEAACLVTLAYTFASPSWAYGSTLFPHAVTTLFVLLAVFLAMTPGETDRCGSKRCDWLQAGASGLAIGWAAISTYTVALLLPAVGAFILATTWLHASRKRAFRQGLCYVAGAALPIAAAMVYHARCFGSPFATGYSFQGRSALDHSLSTQFAIPLGRGFVSLMLAPKYGMLVWLPILWLAIPGFVHFWRRARLLCALFSGMALLLIAAYAKYPGPCGGGTWDVRYLTPILPLIYMAIAPGIDAYWLKQCGDGWRRRQVAYAALFFGLLWVTLALGLLKYHLIGVWSHPLGPVLQSWEARDCRAVMAQMGAMVIPNWRGVGLPLVLGGAIVAPLELAMQALIGGRTRRHSAALERGS